MVITNVLTNCKTDECRKSIFEQEVHIAFFNLMDAILNQLQFELSQKKEGKIMVKRIIILLFLTIQSVNADECTYKTETISENGVIVSTKQIKECAMKLFI